MRYKTIWTVTGPIKDSKDNVVVTTVMRGSVTGDRFSVVESNIAKDIGILSDAITTKLSDYTIVLEKVEDTKTYYKMEPEPGAADGH